jgi:aminopeptidase YwaD
VGLLEEKSPLAIITATGRNPELAGGMYPFPLMEDGDFDIPSVYIKDVDGERLAGFAGETLALTIDSTRIAAKGCNVIARKPAGNGPRVVLCAHIDAKDDTPGALDNGTGIVMLALLAERLTDYAGPLQVELLAFNGEDHYSAQGHKEYLKSMLPEFDRISLAINTDVAGYVEGLSAFSLYGTSDEVSAMVRGVMDGFDSLVEGEPWYQSDHSVFIQNGRPAVAITSEHFMRLSTEVTHTPKDDLDLVDFSKLVDVVLALEQVVRRLNEATG